MKKTLLNGLLLAFVILFLSACSKDNNLLTNPAETSVLNLNFFEANIQEISKSRADDTEPKAIKEAFTRLDVALFPDGKTNNADVYRFHQTSSEENFGKLSIRVPYGKYKLVAIASKANEEVTVTSQELAAFPGETVTDMAYVCQDVTADKEKGNATCLLKRSLSKFSLQSSDKSFTDLASIKIKVTGKCNYAFNPLTGFGIDDGEKTMQKEWTFTNPKSQTLGMPIYLFLPTDEATVCIDVEVKDKAGTTMKSLHFDNVILQQNHVTTYTGPVFSNSDILDFSFANTALTPSEHDLTFTE